MVYIYPYISIIVPVYRAEEYLHQCINSILTQTFRDFELLLIDDGSPDNSGQICDEYAQRDGRIRVFHKENGGVSSARNVGLDNAKGKWIVFCDSDDWVEKDWLESYHNVMNNNYDIIFQGYIQEHHSSHQIRCIRNVPNNYINTILLLEQNDLLGWTWCKIFKTDIIKANNIRFDKTLNINEDLLFTLQYCFYAHSISVLPIAKYHYIIHQDSLVKKRHPYKELQNKSELIKDARLQLANRDGENLEYNHWIRAKYCIDLIGCLKKLYSDQVLPPLCERLKMLKNVCGLNHRNVKYSIKDKLLLVIIKMFPYSITDCILRKFQWFNNFYNG